MSAEEYQYEKWKSRKFWVFVVVLALGVGIHLIPGVVLSTTMAGFLVTMAAGYGIINVGNKAAVGKFQMGSDMVAKEEDKHES